MALQPEAVIGAMEQEADRLRQHIEEYREEIDDLKRQLKDAEDKAEWYKTVVSSAVDDLKRVLK